MDLCDPSNRFSEELMAAYQEAMPMRGEEKIFP